MAIEKGHLHKNKSFKNWNSHVWTSNSNFRGKDPPTCGVFIFIFFEKGTYNIRKLTFQNFRNFRLLQVSILCKISINLEKDEMRNFETLDFRIFKLTPNFMSR